MTCHKNMTQWNQDLSKEVRSDLVRSVMNADYVACILSLVLPTMMVKQ
jgi:hypothetical protein